MSALVGLVVALTLAVPPSGVPIDRPVVDTKGVLPYAESEALAKALVTLREARRIQMAIVVVDTIDGAPIEDWGVELFDRWKLGDAGEDNGVLAILAMDDRLSRLEVGYGIEPWLPDTTAKRLLDGMRDELRAGQTGAALMELVQGVEAATADYKPGATPPTQPLGTRPAMPFVVTLFGIAAGILLRVLHRRLANAEARLVKGAKVTQDLVPAARRATLWRKAAPWLVLGGASLIVLVAFRRGDFAFPYLALTGLWMIMGLLLELTARKTLAGAISFGLLFLFALVSWLDGMDEPWSSGGYMLATNWPLFVGVMMVWAFFAGIVAGAKGGGSGRSYSSRGSSGSSYSSSGSSYSSSGSSYSSSSSSSSYSSSSYSGGGGRSGGGGASSSW